jgi:phosphoribosyl-AMP cyclohydrolase / phosphoribosyl-ATP pyrophosphohydrolase
MKVQTSHLEQLAWDKGDGLLPAIVQHAGTGAVLMLGYMNRDALRATLERGRMVFYSRSKQRLWEKGETSGHVLSLQSVAADCDADTLLFTALPAGPVCHTGTATCFGDEAPLTRAGTLSFLDELQQVIDTRIADATTESSYTARLHAAGIRRIAQKVGEEGLEVALAAASSEDDQALIGEAADLLFHLLVLLRERGLTLQHIAAELRARHVR